MAGLLIGLARTSKALPQDDVIAIDRLALLRYFASGLIAGGAGVTLTLLLTAVDIHRQTYIALGILTVLLLFGSLYFLRSAVRWMGLRVPRTLTGSGIAVLVYQVWYLVIKHPDHLVKAFSGAWWRVVVIAVVATFLGAGFRFFAEMEMDDLQYGLDHELGVVQALTREAAPARTAPTAARQLADWAVLLVVLFGFLRRMIGSRRSTRYGGHQRRGKRNRAH